MGVADLLDAFNSVAGPEGYVAAKAFLSYGRHDGIEFQILSFSGTGAEGAAFEVKSNRLRAGTDVNLAAREVAQTLLDSRKPAP